MGSPTLRTARLLLRPRGVEEELKLHCVYAAHFANNPTSGNILHKLGMKYEGRQRGHLLKWGEYLDLEIYGMLRRLRRARTPVLHFIIIL